MSQIFIKTHQEFAINLLHIQYWIRALTSLAFALDGFTINAKKR